MGASTYLPRGEKRQPLKIDKAPQQPTDSAAGDSFTAHPSVTCRVMATRLPVYCMCSHKKQLHRSDFKLINFSFSPHGYNLPLEYTKLVADCSRQREDESQTIWICKPVGQSQGRGIFLFRVSIFFLLIC